MMDVKHIAGLAKLLLDEEEESQFREHLERMLEYVRSLDALDLEHVSPLSHPHEIEGRLREDEPGEGPDRDPILDEAPDAFHSYFRVPSPLKDVNKTEE